MSAPPGLQRERTALAWQRTALGTGVLVLLLLRGGLVEGSPLELAAAVCLAVVVVVAAVAARPGRSVVFARRMMLLATISVMGTGVLLVIHEFVR